MENLWTFLSWQVRSGQDMQSGCKFSKSLILVKHTMFGPITLWELSVQLILQCIGPVKCNLKKCKFSSQKGWIKKLCVFVKPVLRNKFLIGSSFCETLSPTMQHCTVLAVVKCSSLHINEISREWKFLWTYIMLITKCPKIQFSRSCHSEIFSDLLINCTVVFNNKPNGVPTKI